MGLHGALRKVASYKRTAVNLLRFLSKGLKGQHTESYFPLKRTKSDRRIFHDHIRIILKHEAVDNFYFIYGFDGKDTTTIDSYMQNKEFKLLRDRLNQTRPFDYLCLLRDKKVFDIICKAYDMPTVSESLEMAYGCVEIEGKRLSVDEYLQKHSRVFIKASTGECGQSVFYVEQKEDGINITAGSEIIDTDDARSYFAGFKGVKFVVQPKVEQHEEMNRLYPLAVNTLRIVTMRNVSSGKIEEFSSLLRVGAGGNIVDNWAMGGIAVGISSEGLLSDDGYYKPGYGTVCHTHPDTGVDFKTFKVPYFKEAVEMCKNFHEKLPLHSIGWDVAITPSGPIFIEGNDNWELSLMQAAHGPLKDKMLQLAGIKV